jgi:hypothetical protein
MAARAFFTAEALSDLLAYPFQIEQWQRRMATLTAVCAVLSIAAPPLAEMVEMGYAFQAVRCVAEDGEAAVPERVRWGQAARDGLRWWLVSTCFNLPAVGLLVAAFSWVMVRFGPPLRGPAGITWPGLADGWPFLLLGLLIALPVSMLGGFFSQVAAAHAASRGTFWAAFEWMAWGRALLANLGGFARGWLALLGLSISLYGMQIAISLPTAPLIVVPALAGSFFSLYRRLIASALYARLYREGMARQGV